MPQTVLITGANRGIGLALTKEYLSHGDHVIATCRNPDRADALKAIEKENSNLSIMPLDVTDESSIAALIKTLNGKAIDILINNAGILSGADKGVNAISVAEDASQTWGTLDVAAWLKVFQTNTIAPLMVTQALFDNLKKGHTRKVAMISSKDGSITHMDCDIPFAYGTSKAALNAATKILSSTLQKEQFVVVTLNPGWVRTDMGGEKASLSCQESARRVAKVIEKLGPDSNGQFIRHTGEIIPW